MVHKMEPYIVCVNEDTHEADPNKLDLIESASTMTQWAPNMLNYLQFV